MPTAPHLWRAGVQYSDSLGEAATNDQISRWDPINGDKDAIDARRVLSSYDRRTTGAVSLPLKTAATDTKVSYKLLISLYGAP